MNNFVFVFYIIEQVLECNYFKLNETWLAAIG